MGVHHGSTVRKDSNESPSQWTSDDRDVHISRGPEVAEVEGFEVHVIKYEYGLCVPNVVVDS